MHTLGLILAMAAPPGSGGQQQSPIFTFGFLGIMIAIFYFMLIRPQQRKERERKELIANIKTGDRIIFGGGLLGQVTNVKDKTFVVKVADNTKIEVLRSSVVNRLTKDEEAE